MHTVSEALSALGGLTAPAALITACSLLLLGVYDKYSKIVASLRALHAELRAQSGTSMNNNPEQAHRESQIKNECGLLQTRLRSVLGQILAVAAAMVLFLLASLSIGAAMLLNVPTTSAAVCFVILGLAALIVAMVSAALEARFIWDVVSTELTFPTSPPSPSIRSKDGSIRTTDAKGHA